MKETLALLLVLTAFCAPKPPPLPVLTHAAAQQMLLASESSGLPFRGMRTDLTVVAIATSADGRSAVVEYKVAFFYDNGHSIGVPLIMEGTGRVVADGTKHATFRLYDTGWRLEG